jgi:glycine/D-amino acid oxidase-like deaminating enzyme
MIDSPIETAPIWRQLATPPPAAAALAGAASADLVVVGGGLAGLAMAYAISVTQPDRRVVLLEAGRIGDGATGRCTGIVGPGLSMPLPKFRRKFGHAAAAAAFAASRHGVTVLRDVIHAEQIDCDARDEPHTLAALTIRQQRRMARHLRVLAELGHRVDWLPDAELAGRAGPGYLAGFSYSDVLLVDPYRLCVGLAMALRRRGVAIFEHSRVVAVAETGGRPLVRTAHGRVTAESVVLCVDGYAGTLNPHPRSVVPIRSHVLATTPLTRTQCAELVWDGRGGVIDQRNFFNFYRITADRRLVFGGGPTSVTSVGPRRQLAQSARVFRRLQAELADRFPGLADVAVAARWSGLTAGSLDRLPVAGPVPGRAGLHYLGSWCGHGLSMSVEIAWQYARVLAGADAPRLPWFRAGAFPVPSALLREAGTGAYLRLLNVADHRDIRRQSKKEEQQ